MRERRKKETTSTYELKRIENSSAASGRGAKKKFTLYFFPKTPQVLFTFGLGWKLIIGCVGLISAATEDRPLFRISEIGLLRHGVRH
jgi:hypothetical protein